MTIPIVSVICALTLLPALLYLTADGLDRVRLVPRRLLERRADTENGFWMRLARAIMRHPVRFAAISVALLLAMAIPAFWIEVGPGTNQGIPQDLESTRALTILGDAAGDGATAPTEIVVDTGRAGGATDPTVLAAVDALREGLEADPETVSGRDGAGAAVRRPVISLPAPPGYRGQRVRHPRRDGLRRPAARRDRAGGRLPGGGRACSPAADRPRASTSSTRSTARFPGSCSRVLALTYVLLLRAFRSLVLPLKAIVLNLLSIGAAYGLLVVFFKWGAGEPFGLQSYDQIEGWIPVFLFAMLFGLSMDYEVFLVSRMREEWDAERRTSAPWR